MALIEHKRLISKDSKVDWIAYDTNFVDPLDDCITIYRKADGSYFTDDGYTTFNLDCFASNWRETGTIDKICKRYGCEMVGKEMQAERPEQLLQAMMAVYAWIDFRRD